MSNMELFELLGSIQDRHILEARSVPTRTVPRRMLFIAAVVALSLLLMGCTVAVAYAQGWFPAIFAGKSAAPLTDSQIEYLETNEQPIAQTVENSGWQVELKSTLCDGDTGFVLFGITAPEDVDLEGLSAGEQGDDWQRIVPGNESMGKCCSRLCCRYSCYR